MAQNNSGTGIRMPSRYSTLPTPRSSRSATIDYSTPSGLARPLTYSRNPATTTYDNDPYNGSNLPEPQISPVRAKRASILPRPAGIYGAPARAAQGLAAFDAPLDEVQEQEYEVESTPRPTSRDAADQGTIRRPRPSITDRTILTLSQLPASPAPARKTSVASTPSHLRQPARPASALGSGLPMPASTPSKMQYSPTKRPTSYMHRPAASVSAVTSTSNIGGARPGSSFGARPSAAGASTANTGIKPPTRTMASPTKARPTSMIHPRTIPAKTPIKSGIPPAASRPASGMNTRPSISNRPSGLARPGSSIGRPGSSLSKPKPAVQTQPSRPLSRPAATSSASETSNASIPLDTIAEPEYEEPQAGPSPSAAPKSSQALREQIALARAAHRKVSKSTNESTVPRSSRTDSLTETIDTDLSTFDLNDTRYVNLLRKRVNASRSDGRLNISALSLTEIPAEVLDMYASENRSGPSWYEAVEVTRLNAADNEIAELPARALPSDPSAMDEPGSSAIGFFRTLESVDLHGNMLTTIPLGFKHLYNLSVLNLTRNQLGFEALEILCQITSLRELSLAEAALNGAMSDSVGLLENLEVLDLHGNSITEISTALGQLSKLKVLNVADNRLSSVPFHALFDLPISELLLSRNRLDGTLLSSNITQLPHLQVLDVAHNALMDIAEHKVELPKLKTLNIANNRIAALPSMAHWSELVTLIAEENKISAFPEGFSSLKKLETADFSNNSLLSVDTAIGEMDSLKLLRLNNNPIRERRLLRLNAEDLKNELKSRVQTTGPDGRVTLLSPMSPSASSVASFGTLGGGGVNPWTVVNGSVDRTGTRLREVKESDVFAIEGQQVHTLTLAKNQLQIIPPSLHILSSTLTTLDLSNNKLGSSSVYLTERLSLPSLQTLNLTSNALTSLTPLIDNLSAPNLSTLILLFNRLTSLPPLCNVYPSLTKLLASNNVLSSLDVAGLHNLTVLDVSSNELDVLPIQLGLLQGQLRTLMVTGNKFRVPSWGILEKGTEEVLKWCRLKLSKEVLEGGKDGLLGRVVQRDAGEMDRDKTRDEVGLGLTF